MSASDLRAAYAAWCAIHGDGPLSQQRFGVELKALGYAKWKSCGLIRYRDLQLVASRRPLCSPALADGLAHGQHTM